MSVLYIDADACPVKSEAEKVATRHKIEMKLVSNGGLRMSQNPLGLFIFFKTFDLIFFFIFIILGK